MPQTFVARPFIDRLLERVTHAPIEEQIALAEAVVALVPLDPPADLTRLWKLFDTQTAVRLPIAQGLSGVVRVAPQAAEIWPRLAAQLERDGDPEVARWLIFALSPAVSSQAVTPPSAGLDPGDILARAMEARVEDRFRGTLVYSAASLMAAMELRSDAVRDALVRASVIPESDAMAGAFDALRKLFRTRLTVLEAVAAARSRAVLTEPASAGRAPLAAVHEGYMRDWVGDLSVADRRALRASHEAFALPYVWLWLTRSADKGEREAALQDLPERTDDVERLWDLACSSSEVSATLALRSLAAIFAYPQVADSVRSSAKDAIDILSARRPQETRRAAALVVEATGNLLTGVDCERLSTILATERDITVIDGVLRGAAKAGAAADPLVPIARICLDPRNADRVSVRDRDGCVRADVVGTSFLAAVGTQAAREGLKQALFLDVREAGSANHALAALAGDGENDRFLIAELCDLIGSAVRRGTPASELSAVTGAVISRWWGDEAAFAHVLDDRDNDVRLGACTVLARTRDRKNGMHHHHGLRGVLARMGENDCDQRVRVEALRTLVLMVSERLFFG